MIFEPETWEKPTPKEMSDFAGGDEEVGSRPMGSMLGFRKHLSPLDVYKYLVARFGQPYGFQTFVKKQDDSDNLVHWDYIIKAGSDTVYVQGGNRDVQVFVSRKDMSPKDWARFARALKGDFKRLGPEMGKVQATLEKWSVVSNRFARIADTCAELHDILTEESATQDFTPHKRHTEKGVRRYYRQVERMGERANRVFGASCKCRSESPQKCRGKIPHLGGR